MNLIDLVKFDGSGLVPAIAQDFASGEVLMLAWMNAETLAETLAQRTMVYYSRSRKKRWLKGESSGNVQRVREVYIDCDGDTVLFKIDQTGAACHENYFTCFFRQNIAGNWIVVKEKVA